MSDDLVARLRAQATVLAEDHPAMPTWVLDSLSEAADRIEELTALCGWHDPTGADHMEDAARLADENDELRAENERLGFQLMDIAAERDTLAEMVRVISPYVERDTDGDVGVVAGRNFYSDSNWTEADAERFQRVLDKLDPWTVSDEAPVQHPDFTRALDLIDKGDPSLMLTLTLRARRRAEHGSYCECPTPLLGTALMCRVCLHNNRDQAERFQQVLDRITKETSDDE